MDDQRSLPCLPPKGDRRPRKREGMPGLEEADDFKPCNDGYGHLAGDDALRKMADAMRHCCGGPADFTARFGGEEFVLKLPSTRVPGARALGEQLRLRVEALRSPH